MAVSLDIQAGHVPFVVTATLRSGAGWDRPYGLDLAGIIAAHQRRVQKAAREQAGTLVSQPPPDTTDAVADDLDLPLSRCATGTDWHWTATCAIPVAADEDPETRMFYRTVDSSWSERAATRPLPYFSPKSGPYRDVMMASQITMCPAITWRGIGDINAVRAAVAPIWFLGRRRNAGEGEVLTWTVEEAHPDDLGRFIHADTDDAILRPCPTDCAEALGVDYRVGLYALRPPSWHPDMLTELAMTAEPDDDWFD